MATPDWNWQKRAACRGEDLVLFFGPAGERQPEKDVRERKAKAICSGCSVRPDCLSYALSHPEKYGTWGGLNDDERASERRRRMRREQRALAAATPIEVDQKRCTRCEETKSADDFYRDPTMADGLRNVCRCCRNTRKEAEAVA